MCFRLFLNQALRAGAAGGTPVMPGTFRDFLAPQKEWGRRESKGKWQVLSVTNAASGEFTSKNNIAENEILTNDFEASEVEDEIFLLGTLGSDGHALTLRSIFSTRGRTWRRWGSRVKLRKVFTDLKCPEHPGRLRQNFLQNFLDVFMNISKL